MRIAWRILAGALVLVAVLLVGVVVVLSTVDVDTLIGPVKERVKAATGRELQVRSGARLTLSLQPRLVLNDVALGNARWGHEKEMISAQRVELEMALLPLLSRRFELIELVLVRPVIALETNAQGEGNWSLAPGAPTTSEASAGAAAASNAGSFFAAGNVVVTDGMLSYRDGASGRLTRVAIDRMFVRARNPSTPIVAEFRGRIDDVPVSLEGTFGPAEALLRQQWPYPVSLHGEVAGQKAALTAKITPAQHRYTLGDLKLALGANTLTGSFAVVTGGARPQLDFDLSGPELALHALPLPLPLPRSEAVHQAAAVPVARTGHAYLFPDTPLDFAPLRAVDATGKLAVGRLALANGRSIENLRVQGRLHGGALDVPDFSLSLFGGSATGALVLDASRPGSETLTVRAKAKDLQLEALLAAVGQPRDVRGGNTEIDLDLTMRGASLHAWAASANGSARAVVGPATLPKSVAEPSPELGRLLQAINPFRATDASTELRCAVLRLPLHGGVAKVDRSIAMETTKAGVSASGTLDFRNETMNFTFAPRLRQGIAIDVPSLANLVRVSGSFASPKVSVDAVESAKVIASIGAAISTGGLSAVGQTLIQWADDNGQGLCEIALKGAFAAPASTPTPAPAGSASRGSAIPLPGDIGRALGKLLGK
ncbi:MAG: AsmA family protein [Burkholderiales bacterium]|nr:AsmA family protein [Burkholderiales bacterium]